jgi:hypothetical protein
VTVVVSDPSAVAARWAQVLGVPVSGGGQSALRLDGGQVWFAATDGERAEGLVEIAVELPPAVRRDREALELGGVRFRLLDAG